MASIFVSQEWAHAFRDALNNSQEYAQAGVDWTHGTVALVARGDPGSGGEDTAILLDVHGGTCRFAAYVAAPEARLRATFVIEAPYARWVWLMQSGTDPVRLLLQGGLRMTKGHLPTLVRYVESSKALLACAMDVDSVFLEES